MQYLATLNNFFLYYGSAIAFFAIFARIYTWVTPHREWREIKDNRNVAASVAFVGSLIGAALPICSLIIHAVDLVDFAIWAAIVLVVQLVTFWSVAFLFKGVSKRIEEKDLSAGICLAGFSVIAGLINAACVSY